MSTYRYSARRDAAASDGVLVSAADLMDQMADDLTRHGDLDRALRQLTQRGADGPDGNHLDGIQDMLQQLRDVRRDLLNRYDLATAWDGMKERLDAITGQERQGIRRQAEQARQQVRDLPPGDDAAVMAADTLRAAAENLTALNELPEDVGGIVHGLKDYPFLDDEARAGFDDFFGMLQHAALDALARDLDRAVARFAPADLDDMEDFATSLNQAVGERLAGGNPDLSRLLAGPGGETGAPAAFEEMGEQLWRQAGRMPSLLASLPLEQHRGLTDVMRNRVLRPSLSVQMQGLQDQLRALFPNRPLGKQYIFRGAGALSLREALRLMDRLRRLDDLERHLERTRYGSPLESIDRSEVEELLGREAGDALDSLRQITEQIVEAGFAEREGEELGLTARGMRRIGQKAMLDIFRKLRKSALGNHPSGKRGLGVDLGDETRPYEFGQPFLLHLERTLLRAAARGGGVPVRLHASDFEVYATEHQTRTATVLMLDVSRSMPMRGNAHAAKKVTLALHQLITTQFPRDNLYVVGFSGIAREVKADDLPRLETDDFGRGTNMQAALKEARRLLAKHRGSARQVIMITDGEPTAYFERNGQVYIELPPSPRVLNATLAEVQRCTRDGIVINTFMLDRSDALREFVAHLTRLNRGRVFFTGPDMLGQYLLVDYLEQKKVMIS